MVPIFDERVRDCIRPISRELLRNVPATVHRVELMMVPDAETGAKSFRLHRVPSEAEFADWPLSKDLVAAAQAFSAAWQQTGNALAPLTFTSICDDEGLWKTTLE